MRLAAFHETYDGVMHPKDSGLTELILDPYVNAIHVSLLRENKLNPDYADALVRLGTSQPQVRILGEKLLAKGPEALNQNEKQTQDKLKNKKTAGSLRCPPCEFQTGELSAVVADFAMF